MLLEEAKRVIGDAGFPVKEVEAMKGSCMVKGLSIGEGTVRPTIYAKTIEDMDERDLLNLIAHSMDRVPEIDLSFTKDKDYILDHCVSCIRHQTNDENAVKWPAFGDLEEYIRLDLGQSAGNENMSTVVTNELLKSTGISREELHIYARRNLKNSVKIQSMAEVLRGLMGDADIPEAEDIMYVATNEAKLNGAAVMLLEDVLQEFCVKHGMDSVYIIPSSLHEVILTSTNIPMCEVNAMIQDVNDSQVSEWERLSDHVYTFVAA